MLPEEAPVRVARLIVQLNNLHPQVLVTGLNVQKKKTNVTPLVRANTGKSSVGGNLKSLASLPIP